MSNGGSTAVGKCPKCGTAQPADAAFCVGCGLQTRDVGWDCGRPLETAWRFCPDCGGDTTEPGVIPCPACREPLARDHAFCTACGTLARPTCDECDRILRRSWSHCPDCGEPAEEAVGTPTLHVVDGQGSRPAEVLTQPRGGRTAGIAFAATPDAEDLNQQGIEAYEREKFDEAITLFRRAVELAPDTAMFHCNLAVACGER